MCEVEDEPGISKVANFLAWEIVFKLRKNNQKGVKYG